jgi:hypothetical protein
MTVPHLQFTAQNGVLHGFGPRPSGRRRLWRLSPGMLPCSRNQFAEARRGAGYRPTFQRNWKNRYFLPL